MATMQSSRKRATPTTNNLSIACSEIPIGEVATKLVAPTWPLGPTTTKLTTIFNESFSGCANPLADGDLGWAVTLGSPACSTSACLGAGAGLVAQNTDWTIQRRVDTSALSGDVQLCFTIGHINATDATEGVGASIDVGDGAGWQRVGGGSIYRAPDAQCPEICFSLSAESTAAAHNPSLGIEISARSTAANISTLVDDIRVSGVESCDGAAFTTLSSITDAGEFTITNTGSQALTAQVNCTFSGAGEHNIANAMVRLD